MWTIKCWRKCRDAPWPILDEIGRGVSTVSDVDASDRDRRTLMAESTRRLTRPQSER